MKDSNKRILIIDTDANAERLSSLLQRQGYAVQKTALRSYANIVINTWVPELIIINIFCPSFSTLEFLDELSKTPGAEQQKVLILSMQPGVDMVIGPRSQVQGYLTKPIDLKLLGEILKKHAPNTSPDVRLPVLVVDEDSQSSDIFRMFLDTAYYHPVIASSGNKALSIIRNETPAAVIIDPVLSDINGFELITAIRSNPQTAQLPIIIGSSLKFNQLEPRGFLTGCPELVASNISDDFILQTIDSYLSHDTITGETAVQHEKPKVLIADDQTILLELMKEMLEKSGFIVYTAVDGSEAFDQIQHNNPDIAVLDYDMPIKDGFTMAQELKSDPIYAHMPIIILSAIADKQTKIKGLSLGIDDYLVKPIDSDELVARIRMIMKRTKQVLDTNPLTHLPGNPSIQARIEREIARGSKFAVLYFDLNQFKAFNDVYGFDAGDKVIRSTANIIVNQTRQSGRSSDFIGHIGGDDFIVVTTLENAEPLAQRITAAFDSIAKSFYNEADRQRGFIIAEDRQGKIREFPLLSISVGIVHNKYKKLSSLGQISQIGSELKHHAKTSNTNKSNYVIDRRTD